MEEIEQKIWRVEDNNKGHLPQTCQCDYMPHPCIISTTEKGDHL